MTMYPLTCSKFLSRRLMLALLAAQFAMPMLIGNARAAGLDEIKKRGLIVATEDDFRPFEFVKDGKPTGFDNELIEDLRGKTVGVQAGSALLARLPELGTMLEKDGGKLGKIVEYTSYPEAYQDLALGRVDYVVNTIINLKTLVAEKPVFELGQAVSGKSFPAWAVAKDSKELLDFLNGFIAKEKESGRFAELQKKWFGEAFPDLPVAFEPEF